MKHLEIDGIKLYYSVTPDDFAGMCYTRFWQNTTTYRTRKYGFFGKIVEKQSPILLFDLPWDIEDPTLTKSFWRERILEQLRILERKKEIQRGEIV